MDYFRRSNIFTRFFRIKTCFKQEKRGQFIGGFVELFWDNPVYYYTTIRSQTVVPQSKNVFFLILLVNWKQ